MVWVYKENNSCSDTKTMIDELYDWITRTDSSPTFPVGSVFTPGVKADTIASLTVSSETTSRFSAPNSSTLGSSRVRAYRFLRGGVDYWFVLDVASQGGTPNFPNLGLYCWITTDTGKTSAQLQALITAANAATPSSPTTPIAMACYPTHGATKYRFFSDGEVIHVAFKRTHPSTSSWQHFSFGKIQKPPGATWVGGEYFSGGDAGTVGSGWDLYEIFNGNFRVMTVFGAVYDEHGTEVITSGGNNCFGQVRVVGAYDNRQTVGPQPVNYCKMGFEPFLTTPVVNTTDYTGRVGILGGSGFRMAGLGVSGSGVGYSGKQASILAAGPNSWNGRSPGVGVDLFYRDMVVTSRYQYLGCVPGIRFVIMENITEDVPLNQDWVVFPLGNPDVANETYSDYGHIKSGKLGVAYKLP